MAVDDSFNMNLNQIMSSNHGEWRQRFISAAKERANQYIQDHFRPGTKINGVVHREPGAGADQIEKYIIGRFVDDEGMQRYMEKFFNENFDRIMEESMTAAIKHQCNRLAFQKVSEKTSEFPANTMASEENTRK